MSSLSAAVPTELHKARRSPVPWAIAAGFALLPLVGGLFMVILKDPETARRLGILGAKAQLAAGTADWPTYLSLLAQGVAIGGAVLFALLAAWVFAREFSDRTVRGLLAIQTPRWAIVTAKATVVVVWAAAVTGWVIALAFGVGAAVGLPGWSTGLALEMSVRIGVVAVLTIALQSITAFVASVGRGYLPPLGWAFFTLFAAQVLAILGWGSRFPWAVPAIVSGAAGPEGEVADAASFVVVGAATVIGAIATFVWWERADQTG